MKLENLIIVSLLLFSSLFADEKNGSDVASISEAFGHIIARHLKHLKMEFDVLRLVKGIQDGCDGIESPMSERECVEAIHQEQEKNFKELSKRNLEQAELFLASHLKDEGIVVLEGGKVQYHVVAKGKGAVIKPSFAPLIRYSVKTLDGSNIGAANQEEPVSLDETIPGLKTGLLGMREGEKRILYIHPDFSYGGKGYLLFPPNVLLIFEIEVIKANT